MDKLKLVCTFASLLRGFVLDALIRGIDSLAQLVEHNTFNVGVLGSSPRRITDKILKIKQLDKNLTAFFFSYTSIYSTVSLLL